ncbi:MAG TPA: transcriptional regulator [Porphyromonadaceae bacterium]|nr:transcriptional regulator [Porphyromonadaceae bacterium]
MPSYWSSSSKISITLGSSNNYKVTEINELYRNIPLVSEKVLSQVLRQLTTDGIIRRELFPDVPPRTEYSVSDFGKTLLPHVEDLLNWGRDNFDTIMSNRQKRQS